MTMLDIKGFKDKDSKRPEYLELYESLPFVDAYSKHTDLRIQKDGPELAIGAKPDGHQDWDIHGKMQLDFLIHKGMRPNHSLLDFGCGTGRLACKAVPYLDDGKYTGIDISEQGIKHCESLKLGKGSLFLKGAGSLRVADSSYDYIWAHSVFTHIPPEVIKSIFSDLSSMDFGQFFFTYKRNPKDWIRTGLKQFQYSPEILAHFASQYGLKCMDAGYDWPAGQKTMRLVA